VSFTRTLASVAIAVAVLAARTVLADVTPITVPNGSFESSTLPPVPITTGGWSDYLYQVPDWDVSCYINPIFNLSNTTYDPYFQVRANSSVLPPQDGNNWFGFFPGDLNRLPMRLPGAPIVGGQQGVGLAGSWYNNWIVNGTPALSYTGQTPALDVNSDCAMTCDEMVTLRTQGNLLNGILTGNVITDYTYTASVAVGNLSGRISPFYELEFLDNGTPVSYAALPRGAMPVAPASWATLTTSWTAPPTSDGDVLQIELMGSAFNMGGGVLGWGGPGITGINQAIFDNITASYTAPEPATLIMLGIGILAWLVCRWLLGLSDQEQHRA